MAKKTKQSFSVLLKPLIEQRIMDTLKSKRESLFGMGTAFEVKDDPLTGDLAIRIKADAEVSLCPYHEKQIESRDFKKITLKKPDCSVVGYQTFITKEMVEYDRLDVICRKVDEIIDNIKKVNFSIKHDAKNCAVCAHKISKLKE